MYSAFFLSILALYLIKRFNFNKFKKILLSKFNLNNYISKLNLLKFQCDNHIDNKICLEAMPSIQHLIPTFLCATAISDLTQAVEAILNTLLFWDNPMNNIGGQEQLERLQNCRSALDSILKEQCAFG